MNGHALCPPPLVGRGRASFFGDRSAPAVGQKAFPCHVPHAKKVLERSSIILQTVGGLLGLLAVPEITKRFLYPAAAPVGNLHQRLKSTGRKLRSPIVKFAIKPYQEITEDRALILQGRNQEGKTTLLRETIPRHRCWGPLALEGIYLNGAKGKGVDSFKEWLTTQMFGMTTTGGSEIDYNLQAYRSKQWFVGFLENLGLPIAPSVWRAPEALPSASPRLGKHTDQPAHPRQPCPGDLRLQLGCWLSELAQFEPRHSLWQGHHGASVRGRCDGLEQGVVPELQWQHRNVQARGEQDQEAGTDRRAGGGLYQGNLPSVGAGLPPALPREVWQVMGRDGRRADEREDGRVSWAGSPRKGEGWQQGLHRRADQASNGLCQRDMEGSQPATDLGRLRGAVAGEARECWCWQTSCRGFSQPDQGHDLLTCSEKVRMLCFTMRVFV